jgi:hypothetical protein
MTFCVAHADGTFPQCESRAAADKRTSSLAALRTSTEDIVAALSNMLDIDHAYLYAREQSIVCMGTTGESSCIDCRTTVSSLNAQYNPIDTDVFHIFFSTFSLSRISLLMLNQTSCWKQQDDQNAEKTTNIENIENPPSTFQKSTDPFSLA